MSKNCKLCGELNQNALLPLCITCSFSSRVRIAPISKKKMKRLQAKGTEKEFFIEKVWNVRDHECEKCGKYLSDPKPHNFDHRSGKGMNEDKRYDPQNIDLLCFGCHYEKQTGQKYKGIDLD